METFDWRRTTENEDLICTYEHQGNEQRCHEKALWFSDMLADKWRHGGVFPITEAWTLCEEHYSIVSKGEGLDDEIIRLRAIEFKLLGRY